MIKFLVSLPLVVFIALEVFIVYQLGNVLFRATNENIAGLVGEWSFFHVVLALIGIILGIVIAVFLYITVVLKPVFYPPLEEDRMSRNKSARRPAESEGKSRKIILIIIISIVVLALAAAGFVFRESIGGFFGSLFSSEPSVDDYFDEQRQDGDDREDIRDQEDLSGQEDLGEPEPEAQQEEEVPELDTRRTYADINYNWTIYYPESLAIIDTEPVNNWEAARAASDIDTQMLYWSEANGAGYAGAAEFAAADPGGVLAAAEDYRVLDDNMLIAVLDGDGYTSVQFWYIDPEGIAYGDISLETQELADEWFAGLAAGDISFVKG